jgi:hypothetical protein
MVRGPYPDRQAHDADPDPGKPWLKQQEQGKSGKLRDTSKDWIFYVFTWDDPVALSLEMGHQDLA